METLAWISLGILMVAFGMLLWKTRPWAAAAKIEFKCLEHMVPLDRWNPNDQLWECPHDGCEAVVDAGTRARYEGVRPPT